MKNAPGIARRRVLVGPVAFAVMSLGSSQACDVPDDELVFATDLSSGASRGCTRSPFSIVSRVFGPMAATFDPTEIPIPMSLTREGMSVRLGDLTCTCASCVLESTRSSTLV